MAEYKYNHYVPAVYTKAWSSSNRIWVCSGTEWTEAKPDKIFGQNYLYVKTAHDIGALNDEDRNSIFSFLNKYHITCNGNTLKTIDNYALNYPKFDNWVIKENGQLVKKGPIKSQINNNKIKTIELEFGKIENKWRDTITRVEQIMQNEGAGVDFEDILRIKEFAFQLKYRTLDYKNQLVEGIDMIFDMVKLPDQFKEAWREEFTRSHFIKSMESIQNNSDKGSYQKMYDIIYNLHIVFLLVPENKKFVTSDNPVYQLIDSTFYKGRMNGLYFPITPKIACFFVKGDAKKYTVHHLVQSKFRKINSRLKNNKYEYYVSSEKL